MATSQAVEEQQKGLSGMLDVNGGCHCGAVKFTVQVPESIVVQRCNCSICSATGFVHYIVPAERFQLTSGLQLLTEYRFNTGQAKHLFCSVCGVKSFYVPRSNPDGYSVNVHCVDWPDSISIKVEDFDGKNWEANAGSLQHLSES